MSTSDFSHPIVKRSCWLQGRAYVLVLALMFGASASAKSEMEKEISHLLSYVENMTCEYERNGDRHSGAEAVGHIQKKFDYFEDDIETTEDFIEYAATKSTFSGKHYLIHCPGSAPLTSQEWLLRELQRFRNVDH